MTKNNNKKFEPSRSRLAKLKRGGGSCVFMVIMLVSGLLAGVGLTVIYDLDDKATEIFGLAPKPGKSKSIAELCDKITNRYAAELDLSDAQKSKVHEVITEHFSGSLDRRVKMLEKLSTVLAPMLSDTKRTQWEQLKSDRIKKWSEGMPKTQPTQ
jgi:hypothetical protein